MADAIMDRLMNSSHRIELKVIHCVGNALRSDMPTSRDAGIGRHHAIDTFKAPRF